MNGLLNCTMCIHYEINLIDHIIEHVFPPFVTYITEKIDCKFKYIFVPCIRTCTDFVYILRDEGKKGIKMIKNSQTHHNTRSTEG